MILVRMTIIAAVGLAFVVLLGRLTTWPYALFCYSVLMAGAAAQHLDSAGTQDVPLWVSSSGTKLFLLSVGLFALASPFLVGLIWFRWWWGLAGYVLGGLGTGLSMPLLPSLARLFLGLLLCVGAVVWMLA